MKRLQWFSVAVLVVAVSCAIAVGQQKAKEKGKGRTPVAKAVCVVHPLGDHKASGTVTFTQGDGYVDIEANLMGLSPGKHGFHIHEFGDCTSADGMSTGGHFNPGEMPHRAHDAEKRHAGDMGNIEADGRGKATLKLRDTVMRLNGPQSIVGRAVIVHADPDDFSQPVGKAGARIACGVIGIGKARSGRVRGEGCCATAVVRRSPDRRTAWRGRETTPQPSRRDTTIHQSLTAPVLDKRLVVRSVAVAGSGVCLLQSVGERQAIRGDGRARGCSHQWFRLEWFGRFFVERGQRLFCG